MYIENIRIKNYISFWLASMFCVISIMIVVGGLTRLTDSGLSITEWQLFSGFLPPLTDSDWNNYFNLYKKIPENNCHFVMDRPESVSLVKPPIIIINEISKNIKKSQLDNLFFNCLFSIYIRL